MKAYIDKSALVVEIDRWKEDARKGLSDYAEGVYDTYEKILSFLNTLEAKEVKEEPVSNDLEESSRHYLLNEHVSPLNDVFHQCDLKTEMLYHKDIENAFKAGAQWQKEQMEKNRIAHCDNITEEQYNLETGFLDSFLDKNKRMPTFLDAIEYGMKKTQKGE